MILERYDHHVMDDTSRIAIVNHWMQDDFLRETDSPSDLNKNKIRYQYGNHLGSASLELNDTGALISYEEYFPYGGTSFTCGTSQKEVKLKEYRYTGKERDEATGLYYYGARYYCAWIGRWLSADPAGPVDGLNLYEYVRGNPVGLVDPDGRESWNLNDIPFSDRLSESNYVKANTFFTEEYSENEFRVIAREEWGAKEPILDGNRLWPKISGCLKDNYHSIIVHHSGNEVNYLTIQQLQDRSQNVSLFDRHIRRKDVYADIPYHFAIDTSGNVYEARPIDILGSHVARANTGRIGVVLMTDLDTEWLNVFEFFRGDGKLTNNMETSLLNLVIELKDKFDIDTLGGHSELLKGYRCPGNVGLGAVKRVRDSLKLYQPQQR
ncbi:putative insecticidal toxin protein [Chitinispirillum alkaliphilum]|nr:putative insecticidal toxin protein [Chitinispirillum alkaliphilum]